MFWKAIFAQGWGYPTGGYPIGRWHRMLIGRKYSNNRQNPSRHTDVVTSPVSEVTGYSTQVVANQISIRTSIDAARISMSIMSEILERLE